MSDKPLLLARGNLSGIDSARLGQKEAAVRAPADGNHLRSRSFSSEMRSGPVIYREIMISLTDFT